MITRFVVSPAMTRLIVAGAGVRAVKAAEMTVSGKAQRGALPWLQRGAAVRCSGRISVRSGDVRNRGQQLQLELVTDDVQPIVAETVTAMID